MQTHSAPEATADRTGFLARLADLTYRRRGATVVAWILLLLGAVLGVSRLAGDFEVEFGTPGSDSEAASNLLEEHFPATSGDSVNVVWEAPATRRSPSGSPASSTRRSSSREWGALRSLASLRTERSGSSRSSSSGRRGTSRSRAESA